MKYRALCLFLAILMLNTSCNRKQTPPDPALVSAVEELARLKSYTETGISYVEYSERLLTSKANIDVLLLKSSDQAAKDKIIKALNHYLSARSAWHEGMGKGVDTAGPGEHWKEAEHAGQVAARYVSTDATQRKEIDAFEASRERQKAAMRAEEQAAYLAQSAKLAAEERIRRENEEAARVAEAQKTAAQLAATAKLNAEQAALAEEQERIRRYAPPGIGYNIHPISISIDSGLVSIPPGSQLKILKTDSDGGVHIQFGEHTQRCVGSSITNDRDAAQEARAAYARGRDVYRDWMTRQTAIAEQIEAEKIRRADAEREEIQRRMNTPLPARANPLDVPGRRSGL